MTYVVPQLGYVPGGLPIFRRPIVPVQPEEPEPPTAEAVAAIFAPGDDAAKPLIISSGKTGADTAGANIQYMPPAPVIINPLDSDIEEAAVEVGPVSDSGFFPTEITTAGAALTDAPWPLIAVAAAAAYFIFGRK